MSSITATIPENQPLVDYLLEKAAAAGPNAAKAYRAVAERLATFDRNILGYMAYCKDRADFYDTLSYKMLKTVEAFIDFYPTKSKYESTNDIMTLLPPCGVNCWHLQAILMILREPPSSNYASPLYRDIYKYYYGYKFNAESRAWVAAEIKKRMTPE